MNYLKWCSFVVLVSIGCSKDFSPDYSDGFATAQFNGSDWKATARAVEYLKDTFGLECNVYNKNGILRQSVGAVNIPLKLGKYTSFRPTGHIPDNRVDCGYFRFISDGDVISESYNLMQEDDNFITISNIDTVTGLIKGTFKLSFKLDTLLGKYNEEAPDFVKFENGEFEVLLE